VSDETFWKIADKLKARLQSNAPRMPPQWAIIIVHFESPAPQNSDRGFFVTFFKMTPFSVTWMESHAR